MLLNRTCALNAVAFNATVSVLNATQLPVLRLGPVLWFRNKDEALRDTYKMSLWVSGYTCWHEIRETLIANL